MSNKKMIIIAILILIIISVLLAILSVNMTKKTNLVKSTYKETTAYVDDYKERLFWDEDDYGRKSNEKSYFDYTFYYVVEKKTYTGGENNVSPAPFELLNGQDGIENNDGNQIFAKFSVYYNPENPEEYSIREKNYPFAVYIFTVIMFGLTGVAIYMNKGLIISKE